MSIYGKFCLLVRWSKDGGTLRDSVGICGGISGDGCMEQQWTDYALACCCFSSTHQVRCLQYCILCTVDSRLMPLIIIIELQILTISRKQIYC